MWAIWLAWFIAGGMLGVAGTCFVVAEDRRREIAELEQLRRQVKAWTRLAKQAGQDARTAAMQDAATLYRVPISGGGRPRTIICHTQLGGDDDE